MEIIRILKRLWGMKPWLALGVAVAVLAGLATAFKLTVVPPGLEAKSGSYGAASTQFIVDSERSSLSSLDSDTQALATRAEIISQFIGSDEVRSIVAERLGVERGEISVRAKANTVQTAGQSRDAGPTAPPEGVFGAQVPLTLTFQNQLDLPVVDVFAQAPTAEAAERLADAAVSGLQEYLGRLAERTGLGTNNASRVVVRQTGDAVGAEVTSSAKKSEAVLVGLGVFLGWCVLIVLIAAVAQEWRRLDRPDRSSISDKTAATAD
jgi:hypothetical protein